MKHGFRFEILGRQRNQITSLPETLSAESGAVAITRRGKPVLAVMPWALYESIVETLEIMGDETLMAALRQGIQDIQAGHTSGTDEVKRELGL